MNRTTVVTLVLSLTFTALYWPLPARAADRLAIGTPYSVSTIGIPAALSDPVGRVILANTAYGLTLPGEVVELGLAQSLTALEGGRVWGCVLRSDLVFSSGRPVTPERVKKSFEFLKQLDRIGWPVIEQLERIDIDTEGRLFFHLKEPTPDFDRVLAEIPIIDTELAKIFGKEFGKGTYFAAIGPYQIVEQGKNTVLGSSGLLTATKNSRLELTPYADALSALSALRAGSVDFILLPTESQIRSAHEDPTLDVIPSPLRHIASRWVLPREFWSEPGNPIDRLITDRLIVRKSLRLDRAALARLDLHASYLP